MRIVFIGKSHVFSMLPLKAIMERHNVVGIIESDGRERASVYRKIKRNLSHLKSDILGTPSLRNESKKLKAKYLFLDKKKRNVIPGFLEQLQPDILCIASLSMLLSEEILAIPKFGAINLHPSKLPKYHGPFPWFWQYHDCELEIGVTVHALDAGQDTGPILKQGSIKIDLGTDIKDAINLVSPLGARLMLDTLEEIHAGKATYTHHDISVYPKARIVRRDERLIDWDTWSIERVWHFLKGSYPWVDNIDFPKELKGKLNIGNFEKCICNHKPGDVLKDELGYFVAHSQGKIRVLLKHEI